jgi:3-hydroxyisobutyrate dehydrogenase-like beta-hydroxyacid dehydrogenase
MAGNLQGQALRRVGVVGLGHMGHALAVNLIEDGHQVFVYDRPAPALLHSSPILATATWC